VHGLLADERAAIIALFDAWGEIDRSHRKLAHRGSYWFASDSMSLIWVLIRPHVRGSWLL